MKQQNFVQLFHTIPIESIQMQPDGSTIVTMKDGTKVIHHSEKNDKVEVVDINKSYIISDDKTLKEFVNNYLSE